VRLVLRLLAATADGVVVLHQPAATALAGIGCPNVHVLANWVEVGEEATPLPAAPPLRLVFAGGLVRRKGVPELIEAMRLVGDMPVELRLVGGAGEDGAAALARVKGDAADLVAAGRVTFAGELGQAGVRAELRAAHVLVLPSEAEGTPMAVLEAMAEGRPVLVSDAGNMRSLVEEAGCGWVLPDRRPATIAEHIRRIGDDPIGLEAAASAARKACEEHHSVDAARPGIDAVLSSVLVRGRPQPGPGGGR
jgi:glycosyltransferase involved in cell wall biosynthesis